MWKIAKWTWTWKRGSELSIPQNDEKWLVQSDKYQLSWNMCLFVRHIILKEILDLVIAPCQSGFFSPPARWGLDFKIALCAFLRRLLLLLLSSSPPYQLLIAVGTAGPQPPDRMPDRMLSRMPDKRMPDRMPDARMPDRMWEDMTDRMSEDMTNRMSEDIPDRMPDR